MKAVLFDMDGVLVDSEKYICEAAIAMFRERGLAVQSDDFIPFVGAGENRYIGGVAEKYGLDVDIEKVKKRTYEIYSEIVHGRLGPLPGAVEFIKRAKTRGLKLAVATSADEIKLKVNLREIGIPLRTFDVLLNGLLVERKKPFPDIYLKAADMLGVDISSCLVVEDAINGVEAACRAGAKCLALTTSFSSQQLSKADWIYPDLSRVTDKVFEW